MGTPDKIRVYSAAGGGLPPRFVSLLDFSQWTIQIKNKDEYEDLIQCDSKEELVAKCQSLAEENMPFSVGGMMAGPSEDMKHWQGEGLVKTSFLEISWLGPGLWQLHEQLPGACRWTNIDFRELLARQPSCIAEWEKQQSQKGWFERLEHWLSDVF